MPCANLLSDSTWLRSETIYALHEAQVAEHGGTLGARDINLLESALTRPQQHFAYADPKPDIPTLAAIYGIAFVRNHPFLDGNKRVGLVALELFLRRNGSRLTATNASCVIEILALAAGERTDEEFIAWVLRFVVPSGAEGQPLGDDD
jgi:death-on-curing protein